VTHLKKKCHDLKVLQASTSSHFLLILVVACGNKIQFQNKPMISVG